MTVDDAHAPVRVHNCGFSFAFLNYGFEIGQATIEVLVGNSVYGLNMLGPEGT